MQSNRSILYLGASLNLLMLIGGCGGGGGGGNAIAPPPPPPPPASSVTFQVETSAVEVVRRSTGAAVTFDSPQVVGAQANLRE